MLCCVKHNLRCVTKLGLAAFCLTLIVSCSGRSNPAPVVSLNTTIAKQNNLTEIEGETYQVQKGDTLFAVAFYSGNDYRDIAKFNNIQAPYNIFPGQKLALTPTTTNNDSKNKGVRENSNTTTKVVVDPSKPQAYGKSTTKVEQRKSTTEVERSSKTDAQVDWIWPASGKSTSAVVGSDGTNRGVDIKGDLNSPIFAAASGKVVYAGNALKGYGNLLIIKHDNDLLSAYAHNDMILVGEQSYVKQGQKIASMGRTGASEVMLHFEIRRKGKSLDPLSFLPKK